MRWLSSLRVWWAAFWHLDRLARRVAELTLRVRELEEAERARRFAGEPPPGSGLQ